MARQGSRCQPKNRHVPLGDVWTYAPNQGLLTRWLLALMVLVGAYTCAIRVSSASETPLAPATDKTSLEQGNPVDAWLRIDWSTEDASEWHIRLRIKSDEPSEFLEFENHCGSDSSTGAFTSLPDQSMLSIDTRERTNGGSMRIHIRASQSAQLVCDLVSPDQTKRSTEVAIADLLQTRTALEKTADATSTSPAINWRFQRSADDSLRVSLRKQSNLMALGESLEFSLGVNRIQGYAGRNVSLRYWLRRVENGETVSSQSWDLTLNELGSADAIEVTTAGLSLPGVYELRSVIETTDDGIWNKFRRRKETVVESGLAVVVVGANSKSSPSPSPTSEWREIQTIRPSDSQQWSWSSIVPATTDVLLSTIQPKPDESIATSEHAGQTVSILDPKGVFETKLPIDRVGYPHLVSVRYPSGASSRFRIDVISGSLPLQPRQSFAINEHTADIGRSPWSTHSFVYYPGGHNESLRLTNLNTQRSAAIHSIRVSAGPQTIAEPISVSSEEAIVALSVKDFGWVEQLTTDFDSRSDLGTWLPETKYLYRLQIAATRLADYVRAAGMNTVIIPANQGGRTWFATDQFSRRYVRPSESVELLSISLHALDTSGLSVVIGFEPTMSLTQVETGLREMIAEGNAALRTSKSSGATHQYQPIDEGVRSSTDRMLDDLMQVCREHACFRGISLNCGTNSYLATVTGDDRLNVSLLKRFTQSHPDQKHSVETSESTRQFELWRHGEGRLEFETWLFNEQRQYLDRVAQRVGRVVLLRLPASHVNLVGESGLSTESWPTVSSNLLPVMEHERASLGSLSKNAAVSRQLSMIATLKPDHSRPLAIAVREVDGIEALPSAIVQASLMPDLSRLVDRVHPKAVIVDCSFITGSISPSLASSLRSIAASRTAQMRRVESRDPNAQSLHLYQDTASGALLAINEAPWTTEVDVITEVDVTWASEVLVSSLANEASRAELGTTAVSPTATKSIRLAAGEVKWIPRNPKTPIRIVDWTSRPIDGEIGLLRVKEAVTQVVERLGVFSETPDYGVLANGGFEQSSPVGIVGWLTAQHPQGAVRVDHESIEGKQSVCLTTDTRLNSRTWIMSDTIPVPASGRLAISLACRGELVDLAASTNQKTVVERAAKKLRITIEGTRQGEPVRFASDIEIPADGRWQSRRIVLELDGLDSNNTEALRLAIDSLSDGRVWIDDVHLHDWFPLESERNDLQSQSFLAVQGLQRGNIAPAARLLRDDWAQYLLTTGGQPVTTRPQQGSQMPPPEKTTTNQPTEELPEITESEAPGMADRLRSWLPRRLRF